MGLRNRHTQPVYYNELYDIEDFIGTSCLNNDDLHAPTFLWDSSICEESRDDDAERLGTPVAPADEAETVMTLSMQWYFDSLAAIVPGAQRTGDGIEMPLRDMPTFRIDSQALQGVSCVVGNAVASNHWLDAVNNLARALEITAEFLNNCADRDNEGLDFLKDTIMQVQVYMDSVARNASPDVAATALRRITDVACSKYFHLNATKMIELLSCTLSFACYDDTRVLAYESLERAVEYMRANLDEMDHFDTPSGSSHARDAGDGASPNGSDPHAQTAPTDDIAQVNEQFEQMMAAEFNADDDLGIVVPHADSDDEMALNLTLDPEAFNRRLHIYAREQFEQAVQFLRHDLLRISGDDAAADDLLRDHTDMEPLADMLALRLISTKRFHELLSLAIRIERERPNQQIMLFPETLVPYQWDSIREIALQGIDNRDELKRIYRERIIEAYDPSDTRALANLHALCSEAGDWDEQVRQIVKEYANGEGRYARNVIYEQMLIAEDMVEEAVEYVEHFPETKEDLALLLW